MLSCMAKDPNPIRLTAARREIVKAVERASAVDLREGHIAECKRRLNTIREEADRLIAILDRKSHA